MNIPKHIAIIMDGNGRWAKERNLPRIAGHKEGLKRIEEIAAAADKKGTSYLTMFAFSTENWNRPKIEIKFLFSLIDVFIGRYRKFLTKENIRFQVIGRRDRLTSLVNKRIEQLERISAANTGLTLIMAIDYGGKWDIVNAALKLAAKGFKQEQITEDVFSNALALAGIPDPDLLIRTSGEQRISNFLLWNLAYTEFYFSKTYWPDFNVMEFDKALEEYTGRKRKYGAIKDNA